MENKKTKKKKNFFLFFYIERDLQLLRRTLLYFHLQFIWIYLKYTIVILL